MIRLDDLDFLRQCVQAGLKCSSMPDRKTTSQCFARQIETGFRMLRAEGQRDRMIIGVERSIRRTNICNDLLVSSPSFSVSKLVRRGLIALASLAANFSSRISILG
jgi:hypothetical protein